MPRSPALAPAHVDLWSDRALVVAPLGSVGTHRHAAAALLIGLDGPFCIAWGRQRAQTTAAFIPAGTAHALECGGTLMATLYLFVLSGDAEALTRHLGLHSARLQVDVPLSATVRETLRHLHGGGLASQAGTRAWLDQAVIGAAAVPGRRPDWRVQRAACLLRAEEDTPLEAVAEAVGLSASRLMHLFRAQAGISAHQYRLWERMRRLTQHVAAGDSLTMAGLAAGFSDSAHLSHGFRRMFGVPPSRILRPQATLRVQDAAG